MMMTQLEELKSLRRQMLATIERSAELTAAGTPERYLSGYDKAERLRLLARLDAAILKLEGH